MSGDEHGSHINDAVEWYDDHADEVVGRYESLAPAKLNEWLRAFLPDRGGFVLDVGAGAGRDAVWLSSIGYEVIAVEPSEQMRKRGQALHGAAAITWLNDRLPGLENLHGRGLSFDFILANAVWMHLPPGESRQRAFRKLVTLLKPGARLAISFRQPGPNEARSMFPCHADEFERLAGEEKLQLPFLQKVERRSSEQTE
jgi:SAM-dependent methyltransferase